MSNTSADKNITVRVPSPLVEEFRQRAKENYKTMSEAIRDLMQEYLTRPFRKKIDEQAVEINRLRDDMETAWGIIANAYGGDWDASSPTSGWKQAATRWRDEAWHRIASDVYKNRATQSGDK